MKHIPNIITCLNLASGFASIVLTLNGHPVQASWMILAAMIFDFSDGFAARALKAYSDMGKELDSISDVISFGAAPGLLIYSLLASLPVRGFSAWNVISFIIAVLFPVCAGLRLAKFNIDDTQKTSFKGIPTPAAALAVVSIILSAAYSGSDTVRSFASSPVALTVTSVLLSLLMVTRIPLLSLKFHDLRWKGNEGRFILISLTVILIAAFRFAGILLVIPVYIAVSLLSLLF